MDYMNNLDNISTELEGIADMLACIAASLSSTEGAPSEEALDRALNSAANHISRLAAILDAKETERLHSNAKES